MKTSVLPTTKTSLAPLALAVSPCSAAVGDKVLAAEKKHGNRCHRHRFGNFSDWSEPVNLGSVVNSPSNEQHPAISPNGLSLYVTSDRPGSFGGFDIYVSQRASPEDDWGPPQNLGPIINSGFSDSVPTFSADGHRMYFCSSCPGGFGQDDIWVSFREDTTDDFAWQPPTNLGSGVNTEKAECGPIIFEDRREGVTTLYFTRCVSERPEDCTFVNPNQKFDIYARVHGRITATRKLSPCTKNALCVDVAAVLHAGEATTCTSVAVSAVC